MGKRGKVTHTQDPQAFKWWPQDRNPETMAPRPTSLCHFHGDVTKISNDIHSVSAFLLLSFNPIKNQNLVSGFSPLLTFLGSFTQVLNCSRQTQGHQNSINNSVVSMKLWTCILGLLGNPVQVNCG
jgi:hypothetical protein